MRGGDNKLGLRSPLARRLILWVVLFSSGVTLVFTALQLYRGYRLDLRSIDGQFHQIERVHVPSLTGSLRAGDFNAVQRQLDGILGWRDVRYLEIADDVGTRLHAGMSTDANIAREFPLRYRDDDQDRTIGSLNVVITLDGVYRRLSDTAAVVLLSNAVKTFLVAGFMLLLFHRLVGRYLAVIARRAEMSKVYDVSSRRRVEIETARLGRMLDESSNEIYLFRADTLRFVGANRGALQNLGYSMDELRALTPPDLKPEYTPETFEKLLYPLRCGRIEQVTFATAHRRKDGSLYPVEVRLHLSRREQPPVFVAMVMDISERRRAEYEIDEGRRRLESVVTSTPVVLWAVDRDGIFTLSEGKGLEQLGLVPGEAIGRSVFEVYRDHPQVLAQVRRALTGESFIGEVNVDALWFEVHYAPARDPQGRSIGAMGVAVDVTERRRAQELLRAERDFSSAVLETVGSMVVVLDREGRIVRFNRACEQLTGYRFGEVKGRVVWEFLIPPEQVEAVRNVFANLTVKHRGGRYQNDWLTRTGKRRFIAWSNAILFNADGHAEFVIATGVDMTEPHRAEAERERLLSELQARNAEMENFVYTVSHDLKNPLITIGGFASLLDRDIAAGKLKQARDSIGEINRAVATLKQHIEDVLALSRAGRVIAEQRPVRLAELVAAVLAPMRERIAALDATVVVAPDLPQVLVNEEGFHRVYTNLIDNAVKYRRAGAAPRIDIGWRRDGAQLRLYVRDNGIGIEPQYRERVFGLFQRLDTHTEGTGVGLAISRRVVEAHGGGMWVESEYGRGSTFWLSLPESVIVRAAVHPNGLDANTG